MVDGLRVEVQYLQAQHLDHVAHFRVPRGDDDRHVLLGDLFAQALDQAQTAFFRHAQVGDDECDIRVIVEMFEGFAYRLRGVTSKALDIQHVRKFEKNVFFVVHEQQLLAKEYLTIHPECSELY
ncbi:hypothetical protein D9M70_585080 [compost metagenome]